MGKIRKRKNVTLLPAYALLAVAFLMGAMFIADFEREYIEDRQMMIAHKYTRTSCKEFQTAPKIGQASIRNYIS